MVVILEAVGVSPAGPAATVLVPAEAMFDVAVGIGSTFVSVACQGATNKVRGVAHVIMICQNAVVLLHAAARSASDRFC